MKSYKQVSKKIKCPICDSDKAQILWSTNSQEAAQSFVLKEQYPERYLELVSHIGTLWSTNTCEVVQCDKCDFCYSSPYVAGDDRFYDLAYIRTGYPKWKWEYQVTYDALKQDIRADSSLLEIGAGEGNFIKKIAENIIKKQNILCTEFSEYGKEQIEKFGVKCLSEDIRNISSPEMEESMDIICMFQVLEHMDNLDILFQKLNWLLKKGGSIFIAVPNNKFIEFNELHGALLDMPPNHIGRWNKKCFEEIAKKNNLYIKDYKIEEFNLMSAAKEFIIFRFMKRAQKSGSLENWLRKVNRNNKYLRMLMQAFGVVINSIMAIPSILKMNSNLGSSQWINLKK